MRRQWGKLILGALVVLVGMAFGVLPSGAQESRLDLIKKHGKLIAGVRYDYPPYGYDDKRGRPAGFGVEAAKYFAKKLGVGLEYVQVTSKARIPLIVNGTIEADIGVTTGSVDREEGRARVIADLQVPSDHPFKNAGAETKA